MSMGNEERQDNCPPLLSGASVGDGYGVGLLARNYVSRNRYVWLVLIGTFQHKHLWLDYRTWPSKCQTNLRASKFPGQFVIVTIAEWLPGYTC